MVVIRARTQFSLVVEAESISHYLTRLPHIILLLLRQARQKVASMSEINNKN